MQQPLQSGGYKWVADATCDRLLEIAQTIDLNQEGALVTIDVFPAHVHDNLADFPPVFEKKVYTPDQYPMRYTYYNVAQRVPKLTAHLAPVHNYTCTMQELLLIVNLGGFVTKTKSILTLFYMGVGKITHPSKLLSIMWKWRRPSACA